MRTQTTTSQPRPSRTASRLAAVGLAAAAAATVTACGGSGGKVASTTGGAGTSSGKAAGSQAPAATPTPAQTFDPAQGPIQDPATLPKTCSGLVTDADIQLQYGGPLAGGDVFTAFLPVTGIKQTKKVICQYGEVLDSAGKFQSDQLEAQMATYADAASAKSRGTATVAGMAASGAQFKTVSVDGHPATLLTEATDTVLVMYDGNRTFLITIQAALAQGDKAEKLAEGLMSSLYKHTPPAGGGAPTGTATPNGTTTPGTDGGATPTTPAAPATS